MLRIMIGLMLFVGASQQEEKKPTDPKDTLKTIVAELREINRSATAKATKAGKEKSTLAYDTAAQEHRQAIEDWIDKQGVETEFEFETLIIDITGTPVQQLIRNQSGIDPEIVYTVTVAAPKVLPKQRADLVGQLAGNLMVTVEKEVADKLAKKQRVRIRGKLHFAIAPASSGGMGGMSNRGLMASAILTPTCRPVEDLFIKLEDMEVLTLDEAKELDRERAEAKKKIEEITKAG